MDEPSRRRRHLSPVLIGATLLLALLATVALAPDEARSSLRAATVALAGWLGRGMWLWPLAAALTAATATSPPARRRWPRPVDRVPPAIGGFAGLVGLTTLATGGRPEAALLAVGVVVSVGLVAVWVLVLPRRLAPSVPAEMLDRLPDRDRLEATNAQVKLQNDLRTTALQAIAGVAILAGAVLGFQQLTEDRQQATATRELTLQGQASERFTRAIDQLGSDRLEVRLGGIYGLEQIAQQAPANRLAVTEVLVAYLHRRAPRPAKPPPSNSPVEELRVRMPDAQAALTVLGRRQTAVSDPWLDLRSLDLRGAELVRVRLVRDADLFRFGNVQLVRANFAFVLLRGADLTGANLVVADLRGADLRGAALAGADLSGADLTFADLAGADLRGANLADAILTRANLTGVNLTGVNLVGADLSGADLTLANLTDAFADRNTTWPDGFDPQDAGVQVRDG